MRRAILPILLLAALPALAVKPRIATCGEKIYPCKPCPVAECSVCEPCECPPAEQIPLRKR